jgi:hypothetical protein
MDAPSDIAKDKDFLLHLLQKKGILAMKPNSGTSGGLGFIKLELKNGEFYASSGPEIYSLTKIENKVTVNCSEADRVFMITDSRKRSRVIDKEGKLLTEATFELREGYTKFRIVVQDKNGKKAYTQFYNVN